MQLCSYDFRFDYYGNFKRINWAQLARDPFLDIPLEKVEPLYVAMRTFEALINDPEMHLQYRMEPGEMVTFSNTRYSLTALCFDSWC